MPQNPEQRRVRDPNKQQLPEWAQRERVADLAWIAENLPFFSATAKEQFAAQGPGVIVVDTTVQPDPHAGHPMYYIPKAMVEQVGDDDVKRMVGAYNPHQEFIVVLLKGENKVSTYHLQVPQPSEPPSKPPPGPQVG